MPVIQGTHMYCTKLLFGKENFILNYQRITILTNELSPNEQRDPLWGEEAEI